MCNIIEIVVYQQKMLVTPHSLCNATLGPFCIQSETHDTRQSIKKNKSFNIKFRTKIVINICAKVKHVAHNRRVDESMSR